MLKLLAENIPTHRNSPFSPYLPGFTALRLLLLKRNRTSEEVDLANTMLDSYSSYLTSGRNSSETAWMVARDYMLLTQSSTHHSPVMPQTLQSQPQIIQLPNSTQQQHHTHQVQQQPLQQQLNQGHTVGAVQQQQQQQQQQNAIPKTQHIQQLHSNQYQQVASIQKIPNQITRPQGTVQQQENPMTAAPGAQISYNSLVNQMRPPATNGQDTLSTLGHLATHATQNGQTSLSSNGITALSRLAQNQHHMTQANGISTLPHEKNGVPGV